MRGYLLPFTLNIFGSNIGHLKKPDFYLIFGTLRNEKSSHTAISFLFSNGKKHIPIILLLKWPLFEQKMFTVHCLEYCFLLHP